MFQQFIATETAARHGAANPVTTATGSSSKRPSNSQAMGVSKQRQEVDVGAVNADEEMYEQHNDFNHEQNDDFDQEVRHNSDDNQQYDDDEQGPPGGADPGVDPQHQRGPGDAGGDMHPPTTSQIGDIQTALEYIALLKQAVVEDSGLDQDDLDRLRNPARPPLDILEDPQFRLSLDLFLACTNASQATFNQVRSAIQRHHPDDKILSYDQIKRRIKHLTGIVPLVHDMCINSCLAYTGPFEGLDACPICSEPRYVVDSSSVPVEQSKKIPRQQFSTLPIGPQIQALWSREESARDMEYLQKHTDEILQQLRNNNGQLPVYDDVCCGHDYLAAVQEGKIKPGDTVLLFSIDGAQLYRNKKSDCWISIWIILNLSPDKRYKVKSCFPGMFIPGPHNPKIIDSFSYPGLRHLSAIQRDGLAIYNGSREAVTSTDIFVAFVTADAVAMADLIGWVGHHGKFGCRYLCGLQGRHKPYGGHYFPALLKPHNYAVSGCDHADVDINNLPVSSPTAYRANLRSVIESPNPTAYIRRRREAGICKPSIFDGLSRILPLPRCFPGDSMHLTALNSPDLLLSLWRGTMDCDPSDNVSTWDWAVLRGQTWVNHGKQVADAASYIPSSYGRTPRNPAEKISSGYKACEFLIYIYGLGPALFYHVLPEKYWVHFCKLVHGVRLLLQRTISRSDLVSAHQALLEFVVEFEVLYYQRRTDRLHFVRQSVHALTHLATEVHRVGPITLLAQWVMERTIGNLGQEIRQPSNPYANLAQRGLLRCQVNALKAMIPDLAGDNPTLPHGAIDIGDGYALLRKKDSSARAVKDCEAEAIRAYLNRIGGDVGRWDGTVTRWARLALPNGQIARSSWTEQQNHKRTPKRTRNITVTIANAIRFAEAKFYFALTINRQRKIVALVSLFSPPNQELRTKSRDTLWVCKYGGDESLLVVDVKSVRSVVSMVPFYHPDNPVPDSDLFSVNEDLGLDVAELDGDVIPDLDE